MSVRTLLLALLYLSSFGAQAVIITIDPDDYAHGTDLSHVGSGPDAQHAASVNL